MSANSYFTLSLIPLRKASRRLRESNTNSKVTDTSLPLVSDSVTKADVLVAINTIDEALKGSDGAAAAVAITNGQDRSVDAASVGNIRIRVLGPSGQRIPWTEGTLGQQFRRPIVQHCLLGDDTLVMYSDGVTDRFKDADYPAAGIDPPDVAAQTIVQRFGKDYDDSSCAVVRFSR